MKTFVLMLMKSVQLHRGNFRKRRQVQIKGNRNNLQFHYLMTTAANVLAYFLLVVVVFFSF